ncbi:TetR/AcrR family transcriptional regulator, partial [Rubrivirga sp.]|uniref:TetR/AcrR family transcriptional regulator n=1 Tax=Rubrivirga sp. TaxID=1885344 RepID=UPI003C74678A
APSRRRWEPGAGTGVWWSDLPSTATTPRMSNAAEVDPTEQRVLDAALDVFLQRGTAGARTQQIADAAGVSKSVLHYYFRTKERLADRVFEWAARQWFERVSGALDADVGIEELIRTMARQELEALTARPTLGGYIQSEMHHDPERRVQAIKTFTTPDLEALQGRLDAAAEAGEIRPTRARDFVIDLNALAISPHSVPYIHHALLGVDESEWAEMMEGRVEHVVGFMLRALRP